LYYPDDNCIFFIIETIIFTCIPLVVARRVMSDKDGSLQLLETRLMSDRDGSLQLLAAPAEATAAGEWKG